MRKTSKYLIASALAAGMFATTAFADPIRIAFIDPLSGPFAGTGANGFNQFKFAADRLVNQTGGVLDGDTFEIIAFDNKISAKESLIQLQVAIDQGIRYIIQGNSSSVANAISEAINKHNRRNPDERVLFLNYSAIDPALTNDKCNFWHFRFDAHVGIKMDALTDMIAADQGIKKVYIIGQDYSFGKAVAAAAVANITEKRPDIEIVGNELHPIGKVKDFTPYARKIVNSGADAIITGNWGADMVNLGSSVLENGYSGPIYTYYGAGDGITAAFGERGKNSLRLVAEGQINPPVSDRAAQYLTAFKQKYPDGNISQPRVPNVIEMLAKAINEAGTADDVVAVAKALEGMEHNSIFGSKILMREVDHQVIQDVHIHAHTNDDVTFDYDNSGYGIFVETTVKMASADIATSCEMQRPE